MPVVEVVFFTNEISKLPNVEKCCGIDISEDAIDLVRSKYPHIDFQVSSVTDLPFESQLLRFYLSNRVSGTYTRCRTDGSGVWQGFKEGSWRTCH